MENGEQLAAVFAVRESEDRILAAGAEACLLLMVKTNISDILALLLDL